MSSVCLILHNIRSAHNVGAIFRTADAAGSAKLFLTGYTPTPVDRFGRVRKDIAKAALGAEYSVPWESTPRVGALLQRLKREHVQCIAVEQNRRSVDYRTIRPAMSVAFIFGNEVDGLPDSVLAAADVIAEIPMRGNKESLNVSVAVGIALFRMLN